MDSLTRAEQKRERLIKSVEYYKDVLKKWDAAVTKAEGRKPDKNDMKTAPESVQKAYKEYYKLKKYLQKTHSSPKSPRGGRGSRLGSIGTPSPHKIFFGGGDGATIDNDSFKSPTRSKRKLAKSPFKSSPSTSASTSPAWKKSRGILKQAKARTFNPSTSNNYAGGFNFSVFKEKMSFIVSTFGGNKTPSPSKKKRTNETTVDVYDSEKGENIQRKVLIPSRSSKTIFLRHNSLMLDNDNQNTKTKDNERSLTEDESDRADVAGSSSSNLLDESSLSSRMNAHSVSAVWNAISPNPKSKSRLYSSRIQFQSVRNVNSEWLSRCNTSVGNTETEMEVVPPTPTKEGEEDDGGDSLANICSALTSFAALQSPIPKNMTTAHADPPEKEKYVIQDIDSDILLDIPTPSKFNFNADDDIEALKPGDVDSQPLYCPRFQEFLLTAPSDPSATSSSAFLSTDSGISCSSLTNGNGTSIRTDETRKSDGDSGFSTMSSEHDVRPGPSTSRVIYEAEMLEEISENALDAPPTSRKRGRKGNNQSIVTAVTAASKKRGSGGRQSNKQKDGNYVKVDLKRKVFVRGHKKISGAKYRRDEWKMKKSIASKEEKLKSLKCRKCGESGHFQKFCTKDADDAQSVQTPDVIDDSPFPTLQEAAMMVNSAAPPTNRNRTVIFGDKETADDSQSQNQNAESQEVSDNTQQQEQTVIMRNPQNFVKPYFLDCPPRGLMSQEQEEQTLKDGLRMFGYESFRPGQEEAVSRILKGLSTLCILSTGSGKSLCYQLPAYLYAQKNPGAMAICISPLVSLMEDQVQGIPPFLQAAFLHSNMPAGQREKVLEKVRSKKLQILLVSPEAMCGGLFGLMRGGNLPQISFVCIDEVHCVSQWSHNFRPCYLQLSKILREKLGITTILGLTATATEYTAKSICEVLHIDPSGIIRGEMLPENLRLSASRDTCRDEALLTLLRGERLKECESIIIYCTRRDECTRVSTLIRTCLLDSKDKYSDITKMKGRQRVSQTCEAYHAGMSAARRRLVQQQFMSGKIRIVVATVAFGMGIDKSDIRAVIHYNMPKTFESYVQEIGRAGRDGKPAHCHLFLDNVKGRDLSELKRHVFTNSIDRPTLRRLLNKIFQPCKCAKVLEFRRGGLEGFENELPKKCPGHEISFNIEEAVNELDLPMENIMTILCYLELDSTRKWIELLPNTYQTCRIQSYGGVATLKAAAQKCPPLAAAIALLKEKKKFKDTDVYLEFNVIEISATLGWNSFIVKRELKNLEWTATQLDGKGNAGKFRKSGMLIEFVDLAFHLNAPGDLSDDGRDAVLSYLYNHNQEQEKTQLYQLHRIYQALLSISSSSAETISDNFDEEKSESLKKFIQNYFMQKSLEVPPEWKNQVKYSEDQEEQVRRDTRQLLASSRDVQFTGRAVARIFQGISSPCFPAIEWGRNRAFWRKYVEYDFHYLSKIAGEEIMQS